MVQIDFAARTLRARVVFVGIPGAGKASALRALRAAIPGEHGPLEQRKSQGATLLSVTLRPAPGFEFRSAAREPGAVSEPQPLPRDPSTVWELATCTGRSTPGAWSALLEGLDGIVFVADARPTPPFDQATLLRQLESQLVCQGRSPQLLPWVFQWSRRDLEGALPLKALAELNRDDRPAFATVVSQAATLLPLFARIGGEILRGLAREYCECAFEPAQQAGSTRELPLGRGPEGEVAARDSLPRFLSASRVPRALPLRRS